jgi:2-oxoglutarate dehydrogenase E2 component (dihydrolipoamide succinyltransferase)
MYTELHIPQIGESITHVTVATWLKQPGDYVNSGETVVMLDSDKASVEVPSPVSGRLMEQLAAEDEEIAIGAPVARIDESAEAPAEPASDTDASSSGASADDASDDAVRAGPAARQMATESGVSLQNIMGTGKHGRVTTRDIARFSESPGPTEAGGSPPELALPQAERTKRVKMSPLRRTIARRLVEAQQTAAILTTFNEVDMSHIMALRKQYQEQFKKRYGIKLGFMSFFIKAAIEALKEFPAVNAEIDGNEVIYKNYYNVGVAVSGPKGLVVPVIRDADRLSFSGVEQAIAELSTRAGAGKLGLKDFQDGTFTVSNGGIFGSMMSTPILNPPQVGILGMHNIVPRPVAVDGRVEIRPMMYLALSYDHRIIDGREAVSFLVRIKQCVENPERILLEV